MDTPTDTAKKQQDRQADYAPPELRRLGSLKDMTLLGSGSTEDGKPAKFTQPPWR
jgi:hypothetical protein